MLTFVFVASNTESGRVVSASQLLAVGERVRHCVPSLGEELECKIRLLPESNCGWCQILPKRAPEYPLVSEAFDDQFAVIAFGDTIHRTTSCATDVLAMWKKSMPRPAFQSESCFCAIVVDRINRSFVLVGDSIGQRTLRYSFSDQWLTASPHDVCLAATGLVPFDVDLISATSIATVEWSLGGRSLLKNVETVSPRQWIRVEDWKRESITNTILDPNNRIDQRDTASIETQRNRIIETLRSNISDFVADAPEILTELTAGVDSRAVISLLLSVVDSNRVTGMTCGSAGDLDVRIASQLSGILGVEFRIRTPSTMPVEDFDSYCDLLAFACNGDATSLVATTNTVPNYEQNPAISFAGNGGEIYRGYYYPFNWRRRRPEISRDEAIAMIERKCHFPLAPWASNDLIHGVRRRLAEIVDDLFVISHSGYDVLDLFYLYERFGVWAARSRRCFWNPLRWSPFSSRNAARLAFQLPSPIGDFSQIHAASIHRFSPDTYHIPINNESFLPLTEGRGLLRTLGKSIEVYHKVNRRLTSKLIASRKTSPIGKMRSGFFTRLLNGSAEHLFDSHDSVTAQLLGKRNLEQVLDQQRTGVKNHAAFLGSMVTVERWRLIVEQAARQASREINEPHALRID